MKDDAWYSFVEERREIANKIAELQVDNLVLLHGDTHYLAAGTKINLLNLFFLANLIYYLVINKLLILLKLLR